MSLSIAAVLAVVAGSSAGAQVVGPAGSDGTRPADGAGGLGGGGQANAINFTGGTNVINFGGVSSGLTGGELYPVPKTPG